MKTVHLLVPGHGGIDPKNGQYTTAPKKQHKFPDGKIIYEGVENRNIVNKVLELSKKENLEIINLIPGYSDISLQERVSMINELHASYKRNGIRTLLWEVHHNAFVTAGGASGTEVFTTKGQNFSDIMANVWIENVKKILPKQKLRLDLVDGDSDQESDFYVIKNSNCYGILMELFFFDNRKEVDLYCNEKGYELWAQTIINSMKQIQNQ